MANFKITSLVIMLTISASLCHAQYDNWTFVRTLPQSEIEDFEPMSQTEILTLSNGIIYYSNDLGSTWTLFIEDENDPIRSLKSDDKGNYYYKNRSGLYKGKIGSAPVNVNNGFTNFFEIHYSLDGGLSWQDTGLQPIFITDLDIYGDYLYISELEEIHRYNFSTNESTKVVVPDSGELLQSQLVIMTNENLFVSSFQTDSIVPLVNHFISEDHGDSFSEINITGLREFAELDTDNGFDRDILKLDFSFESNMYSMDFYHSHDFGMTWEKSFIDSTSIDINGELYYNKVCPYIFVVTRSGRLYRTTNSSSSRLALETKEKNIKVLPNPSSQYIRIIGAESDYAQRINIYTIEGRCVLQSNLDTSSTININNLKSGIYYIEIINLETMQSSTTQFIKE